jgi:phosphohistidine phosphatase
MNLFVLRHASAGTRRVNPVLDVKRPLDKDGKRHCLHLAHVLNALPLNFDLIVSSPLKRSLQTAQLVGTETGYETPILISNALAPEAAFPQFQRLLHECAAYENVLVVGHNPNITAFLIHLLSGPNGGPSGHEVPRIRLRKGSIARLSMQRGPAVLQWLLDPRTVRALYATSTKSSRRKTSRK